MATESKVAPTEDPKIDLFEDDDEFEEFEISEGNSTLLLFLASIFDTYCALVWIGGIGIETI